MLINKLSYITIGRLKQFSHFRKLFSHFRLQLNIFLPYLVQQFQPQSNQCVHSHRYLHQNSAEQLDCSGPDFQKSTCPSPGEQMNITQRTLLTNQKNQLWIHAVSRMNLSHYTDCKKPKHERVCCVMPEEGTTNPPGSASA